MQPDSTGFLLIPGAGLGGWVWRDVIALLDLPARTVEFPKEPQASLGDYVKAVVEQAHSLDRIIMVAHSLGGTVGVEAAAALGDRLVAFAGVSAVLPTTGQSFASSLPFPERLVMPLILRVAGTRPPDKAIRHAYCRDLDSRTADEVVERFAAESRHVYTDKVQATLPQVPSRYLVLTDDSQFSTAQQRKFAESASITDCSEVRGGHLAMLSNPDGVARALNELLARVT